MKIKNVNFHLSSFNRCIQTLHHENPITHKQLADILGISPTGLSNKMNKYLTIEPPLIKKEKKGIYSFYYLTKVGELYYKENVSESNTDSLGINKKETISREAKNAFISYVLANSETIENPYAQILRNIDVSSISDLFDMDEFLFLSTNLGIIPEELFSIERLLEYTDDDNSSKKEVAKQAYDKFQILVNSDIEKRKEKLLSKTFQP